MKHKTLLFYNPSFEKGGVEKNIINLLENKGFTKDYNIKIISIDQFKFKKSSNVKFIIPKFYSYFVKNRLIKYLIAVIYLFIHSLKSENVILSFQNNIFAILVTFFTKNKIIIRLNTAPKKYIMNNCSKKFFSFFYKKSDLVLCNSIYFKKDIKNYFGINAIFFKNFLNVKVIEKLKKIKCNEPFLKAKNSLKLISIGRLVDQKNHIILIKAAKLFKFKFKILIIGDGNQKESLLSLIKKNNLEKRIKIISYTKNPYPYIFKSDIFVLSSKFEGMPNILLEAAIIKTLIVSSDCPTGPKELIKNKKTGFLFKNNSEKSLAKVMNKIYNKDNKKIINKIYANIKKDYEIKKNINNFKELINKI